MQKAYVADGAANPIRVGEDDETEPVFFDAPDAMDADFSEVDTDTGEVADA